VVTFESVGIGHAQVDYSRLAGKVPVLLLNTESFNWAALRNGRKKFMKGRAQAHNEASPLITALMTIKGTTHMDQCDFPLLFPNIAKIAGYVVLDGLERKELLCAES
jgi:hypothetical protein